MQTFSRLVPLPENRLALAAVQRVAACLGSQQVQRAINPLFMHGPAGTGKTHLLSALVHDLTSRWPDLTVSVLSASAITSGATLDPDQAQTALRDPQCDLLAIEDLQHLPPRLAETVVQLFDGCLARQQQLIFTATVGPGQLGLSTRLTSRLASGLVVGLQTLSADSRLALVEDMTRRRRLRFDSDVLLWLADHLGSARQLEGALNQLEVLAQLTGRPPDLDAVLAHFREEADATRPTVERIAQRVGGHFQVDPRHLRSRRRHRLVLLPRQVSMYLARQLTGLSLEEIGSYFGGRDHSTVLHACRKVEETLDLDTDLAGTVRQLHADLA